jgi:tryptophanyl-tRNA synthetase
MSSVAKNLVSGMRATGRLHLGHYLGVLRNWVKLQEQNIYNCYFFIADWHSLTTKFSEEEELHKNIIEITKDFLACGLDPNKATIYVQSAIKEISELHLLLSMITPNNWAERDPTLKDLVKAASMTSAEGNSGETLSYGMLGYPILQTADILAFRGELVPVGKDQEAHLEMSRDIANRFNYLFKTDFLAAPKPLFTETPTVKGLDGGKMSKSYANDIKISASEEETLLLVKKMITDANRIKKTDPGNTENCVVPFPYYKIFASPEEKAQTKFECETAARGCMDCKISLAVKINAYFAPMRAKRNSFEDKQVLEILHAGNAKAKKVAAENLAKIKDLMKIPAWS